MSSNAGRSTGDRNVATGPWDMDITRALLRERIDRGEIEASDIDLFRKGYRWIMLSTFLGGLVGVPVYYYMGKRRPPPSVAAKLGAALFMSSSGSFLGFTIGGAAAAMEVNSKMTDSKRKIRVFEQVMRQSKQIMEDRRAGKPVNIPAMSSIQNPEASGDADSFGSSPTLARADAFERQREAERERQLAGAESNPGASGTGSSWDRLREQGGIPGSSGAPPQPARSNPFDNRGENSSGAGSRSSDARQGSMSSERASPRAREAFGGGEAGLQSAKDRYGGGLELDTGLAERSGLSTSDFGTSVADRAGLTAGGLSKEERDRERREFEALLEKERRAGDDGLEMGKWK